MQNLFEVFLCLGVLIYLLSLFSSRVLGVKNPSFDMLLGFLVLFPAGFVFSAQPQNLPPALQSPLFAPHVLAYLLAYIFMAKAFVNSLNTVTRPSYSIFEKDSYLMVCAGFPLLTAGLLLGSIWGQLAWGSWWGWDPKEMWSLATWLIFAGYLHWRTQFHQKYPRINAAWVISGFFVILITLLWVNLSKIFAGLHSYAR